MAGRLNLPHSIKSHPASHQSKITCTSLVLMNFRLSGQFHTISAVRHNNKTKRKGFLAKTMALFISVFKISGR